MNRSLKNTLWFITLLTVAGAWYGFTKYSKPPAELVELPAQVCVPQQQWCEFVIEDKQFRIQMPQHIHYLQPFTVTLQQLNSYQDVADDVILNFQMPNMSMGINQFMAGQATGSNVHEWIIPVILPVCASGRTGWVMDLVMSVDRIRYKTRFSIQVEK